MGKKRRVNNNILKKSIVKNTERPSVSNSLSFDFSYKNWLSCINNKQFINKLKDESHFGQYIFEILYKLLPTVQENWQIIKNNTGKQFPHCHTVSKEKIKLVEQITEEIHGRKLLDDIDSDDTINYWQLGLTQSVRLIAVYNSNTNTMFPVFVDYHHQIHPSKWHNQNDINKYDFCPVCNYTKQVTVI